jgi:hypothetical protein
MVLGNEHPVGDEMRRDSGHHVWMSRPGPERVRVSFRESVELGASCWDGGASDSLGLSLVLIPMTSLWFLIRGVPHATHESALARRKASGIPASGWTTFATYAMGIFGVLVLVGLVAAGVVVLF